MKTEKIFIFGIIVGSILGCGTPGYEMPCPRDYYTMRYSQEQGAYVGVKAYACSPHEKEGLSWYYYDSDDDGIPCDKALNGSGERKACEKAGYFKR